MSDAIDKPKEPTFSLSSGKLTSKTSSFNERVRANKLASEGVRETEEAEASRMLNRICMMLDCSGSMAGTKNHHLRQAGEEFLRACNFGDTSVALHTFGSDREMRGGLSRNQSALTILVNRLDASGGTPMGACANDAISSIPMTRGIIVGDGQPFDWAMPYNEEGLDPICQRYVEAGIPIDTVHIGNSHQGVELMKYIARVTGGIFIKFSESGNFAQAFKYLSPTYRAMLGDGRINLKQLGADEVK